MCSTTVLDTQKLPCTSAVDESRAQTNFVSDGPCYDHAYALAAKQCSDTVTSDCDNRELKSCSSCHSSGKYLHRIKQNGTIYLYCVSCVLFHHRNMYCSQCFHVYASPSEIGDLALWLTCSNCHRLCHMKCATEVGLPTDSFFFSCQYCHRNSSNKDNENGSRKRLHLDAECSLLGKENLAATQIVAMFAVQEAKRAKDRARSCAAFAAKAAKAAKSALDKAHKAAIDEAICRLQAHQHSAATSSLNPGGNNLQKEAHSTVVKHPHTIRDLKNNSIQSTPMVACGQADPKAFSSVNRTNGPKFTGTANLSHHQRRVIPPVVSPNMVESSFMPSSHSVQTPSMQHFSTISRGDAKLSCLNSDQHGVQKKPLQPSSTVSRGNGQLGSSPTLLKDHEMVKGSKSISEDSILLGTEKSGFVPSADSFGRNQVVNADSMKIILEEEVVDDIIDIEHLLVGLENDKIQFLGGGIGDCIADIKECFGASVTDKDTGQAYDGSSTGNADDS